MSQNVNRFKVSVPPLNIHKQMEMREILLQRNNRLGKSYYGKLLYSIMKQIFFKILN